MDDDDCAPAPAEPTVNPEWLGTLNLPAQYVNRFTFGISDPIVRIALGTSHEPGHMMYQIAVAMPKNVALELGQMLVAALTPHSILGH